VGKITEHPAFRNAARMLARLFDALHDPQMKSKLTRKAARGAIAAAGSEGTPVGESYRMGGHGRPG
jgi:hypothetical protein